MHRWKGNNPSLSKIYIGCFILVYNEIKGFRPFPRKKIVKTSGIVKVDCVASNDTSPILGYLDFLKDLKTSPTPEKKQLTAIYS